MDSVHNYSWFGIDFGTTNSAAFSFTGVDKDNIIGIHYGDDEGRPFPSVVAIDKKTGEIITGREAKDKRNVLVETHEYFSSIKSIIDNKKTWEIAGEIWTPEDIASEIFASLKKRIECDGNNMITEAVVAVPVEYSPAKKGHLRNAAQKAGINIKMFISEPTAAFCSNYKKLENHTYVAVFDWGGGTLDIAILKSEDGRVKELATESMKFAGNDIDRKLAEKFHSRFIRGEEHVISLDELDAVTKDQLLVKCEKAKCDFEDENMVLISINKYGKYGAVRENMDYEYFSLLIENDIENAVDCLRKAVKQAGLNTGNMDCILCVGGSSKLRPLKEKLCEIYGEDLIYYPDRVMWDIAQGAAITSTRKGGYRLNKSIGMILSDNSYMPLVHKGQRIPCEELNLTLGTVDQSDSGNNEARFIFTDAEKPEQRDFTENFVLPLRGFVDENIYLSCYIDQDNVFKLKAGSNRMLENSYKTWSYDKLKVGFSIKGEQFNEE